MRLFHVSEESNIEVFKPRLPSRTDVDNSKGLVWAINEQCLPNFLTPRACPRVAYYSTEISSEEDKLRFFSSREVQHVIAIENKWFDIMKNTTLYLYEFDPGDFSLQDRIAGYYVSDKEQKPINKFIISDIFKEIFDRNVELRIIPNLWNLAEDIKNSTLNWSLCKMANAVKLSQNYSASGT